MDGGTVFECKTLNSTLKNILTQSNVSGADLPLHYRAQLEQQLLVSGVDKATFIAANLYEDGDTIECYEIEYLNRQRTYSVLGSFWAACWRAVRHR